MLHYKLGSLANFQMLPWYKHFSLSCPSIPDNTILIKVTVKISYTIAPHIAVIIAALLETGSLKVARKAETVEVEIHSKGRLGPYPQILE